MSSLFDAHVHFWDPSARHHDWLAEAPPSLQRRFGPEDMAPGGHELLGVVFVQADCRDEEALDEVHWVQELAAEHAVIRGIVAYAPVHLGPQAAPALELLAREKLVVGVRKLLQDEPAKEIVDPALVEGIGLLAAHGLTFDICVRHHQLPEVAELVRACPEASFVLDHLGKPPVAAGGADPWRANIAAIAESSNVVCKLSGLTTEAAPEWSEKDVRPFLEYALEAFGPQRCMLGSDWPVATLATTVERWFDIVLDVTAELAREDQAAVLTGTAAATYGIALSAAGQAG